MAQPAVAAPSSSRDRWFDLLRALAIIRVSVYHYFPYAIIELAFPSMGVMFALAGSLMANSLNRSPAPKVIWGRVRRLLPAYWALGAVLVPAMFLVGWEEKPALWHLIAWVVPFVDPPSSTFGFEAAEVLWYLVTYLWFVALSPILLWVYNRIKLGAVLLPVVALAIMQWHPVWPEANLEEIGTNLGIYGACWILGFAHRDGTLRKVPGWLTGVVAAVCLAGGMGWHWAHPDAGGLTDIPLAYAVYSLGFVLVLLRWKPNMQWLRKRAGLDKWVSLLNARAVTFYLWNNVAIALCYPIGDALEVWRLGKFYEVGYLSIAIVLLGNAVLLFGWVEDLAARRRLRFLPWPQPKSAVPTVTSEPAAQGKATVDHNPPTMPRMVMAAGAAHAETRVFQGPRRPAGPPPPVVAGRPRPVQQGQGAVQQGQRPVQQGQRPVQPGQRPVQPMSPRNVTPQFYGPQQRPPRHAAPQQHPQAQPPTRTR
ncbi:acyltransferase [Actinoplanes sp. NBRC 101535]|uniref:acyltransferase family protein n=1 Tax=Actinoplanes sp. NBRC 101535 TaxID=3032196 RepID=UPI0024A19843|nr:acyltransferase [Actinoplanes sp. NBRC 101535]GLX99702.1 hypothetical protein Acsp01_00820 [Actinoplanes sp. NBRC 101535]